MDKIDYQEFFSKEEDFSFLNSNLKQKYAPQDIYSKFHQYLPIVCHDVMINYCNGLLLVLRDNLPAKGLFFPIGGRVLRGFPIIDSLKIKVKQECGLNLIDSKLIGVSRNFYASDPFGHGNGTDTFSIMFYAKGKGKLKLDNLHKGHLIVTKEMYTKKFKNSLDIWVRFFMDKTIPYLD